MFNNSYGSMESDGMMNGMSGMSVQPNEYRESDAVQASARCKDEKKGLFQSGFLKNLKTDDLILIGIALLLLMDGKEDNDIFVFIIIALVFLQ